MSNIHLTSLAGSPRRSRSAAAAAPFPWAGELAFCTAFLAVLAMVWMA